MRTSFVLALLLMAGHTSKVFAQSAANTQQYSISTVAGGAPPATPVAGVSLALGTVWGVAPDGAGNIYLASSDLNSVFRLDPSGLITRVAGNSRAGYSGDGGPATSAQLNDPRGVAVDKSGNLFIADYRNARIRKVSSGGIITTVAGDGTCCFSGDGGPATSAQLQTPFGVAVDGSGNLFVSDLYGSRVRKVSPTGIVSTVAGDGSYGLSGDGGPAVSAKLNAPTGVGVDGDGNVFIADYNNRRIRKVSPSGIITTIAGDGTCCAWYSGDGGPATNAPLIGPLGLSLDNTGNLFLTDFGVIREVSPSGIITTVAGGGKCYLNPQDNSNRCDDGSPGAALSAMILPVGVAADGAGNLFIADRPGGTLIRKVSSDGIIHVVAGKSGPCCFSGDRGLATNAQLNDPSSVATDAGGNLYIADSKNGLIRKVSSDGSINTVAGACSYPDDIWAACGITVDRAGNVYASDNAGTSKISPDGTRTKVADHGLGLAVDATGNLFIADQYNNVIHKVSPAGVTTTVAGTGTAGFSGDGGPAAAAQLSFPVAIAVDQAGNLYIADSGNKRIRMVSNRGVISTVADASSDLDGPRASFGLGSLLVGLAVDNSGNVFFEELSSSFGRIRRISPDGIVTTIAGTGVLGYSGDGGPAANAQLNPSADELGNTLAIDAAGNLYVADGGNNAVRILRPTNQ